MATRGLGGHAHYSREVCAELWMIPRRLSTPMADSWPCVAQSSRIRPETTMASDLHAHQRMLGVASCRQGNSAGQVCLTKERQVWRRQAEVRKSPPLAIAQWCETARRSDGRGKKNVTRFRSSSCKLPQRLRAHLEHAWHGVLAAHGGTLLHEPLVEDVQRRLLS